MSNVALRNALSRPISQLRRLSNRDFRPPRFATSVLPPETFDIAEIHALLTSLKIDGQRIPELANYLNSDFERFLVTWNLLKDHVGSALEIGANPYFTTILLREFTDLSLTLTNSFDEGVKGTSSQLVQYEHRNHSREIAFSGEFRYVNLNVEKDVFPWEPESFDVVVFCEVVEHLIADPVAALIEINRVLKMGGTLIISTPNVARLENVSKMIVGENIYDPYSGYGHYGRHNREFTRHELVHLLHFCGFKVTDHFTTDVHPDAALTMVWGRTLQRLVSHRLNDLGQYLFCKASKTGPTQPGRPSELYRSLPGDQLTSWSK